MQRLKEFNKEHPMITRTLVGIVVYILLLLLLWWFTSPETPTQRRAFAQLMVQIAGGSVLLFGLYFAWRRVEISQRTLETQQDQQVTERFTRAIDQLGETDDRTGEPKVEIRLGGIYALERIAKDSPERDYSTVIEVLTAYVRENAPHYPNSLRDKADEPQKPAAPPEHRAAIRAITDVIRRLHGKDGIPEQYLVHLDLHNTNLQRANLQLAYLREANLQEAYLQGANFQGAKLEGAYLQEARLLGAYLQRANLQDANLQGALLQGANLIGALLQAAAGLTQEQLEQAFGDEYTELPEHLERPTGWSQSQGKRTDENK